MSAKIDYKNDVCRAFVIRVEITFFSSLYYNVTTRVESMYSRSNDINESSSILSVQRTVFFSLIIIIVDSLLSYV